MLGGERERDCAGSRADIEHARALVLTDQDERALDEDLGLGTGDERPPVDRQGQVPDPPFAEDVLQWLAPRAPSDQLPCYRQLGRRQRAVEGHVELDSLEAGCLREQPLGVETGRISALCSEVLCREAQHLAERGGAGHPPAASSESRRSSAWIASVNSTRSPSSTWSSRWTVSLIL